MSYDPGERFKSVRRSARRRMAQPAISVALIAFVAGCDISGPNLHKYRDVSWHLVGIDDVVTGDVLHAVTLGSYNYVIPSGETTSCTLNAFISTFAGWNWVEEVNGKVVAVGPARDGQTYLELQLGIQPTCTHQTPPVWFIEGGLKADAELTQSRQQLTFGSLQPQEVRLNGTLITAAELDAWVRATLVGIAISDTMRVPLTIEVSHWTLTEGGARVARVATVNRSLILVFARHESINERSGP